MINSTDTGGMALAGLALATAMLAAGVRRRDITLVEMRLIMKDAHALVNDAAGFVLDGETVQAADDFLSVAEAFADPATPRISE